MYKKVLESVEYIKSKTDLNPTVALVLGSGLGDFADELDEKVIIPYGDIPHFPVSTAPSHKGNLVIGKMWGKVVLCMQGRLHYYEGYDMQTITYPIRVMKMLGIEKLLLTNAAGGLNEKYKEGTLMIITDHINFMGQNPLIGKNEDEFGPRFNDMTYAYNLDMRNIIKNAAKEIDFPIEEGIFVGYSGPSFETPAEIRLFRGFGGDAVGMSTVPEVIVANHCGIKVAAITCITNMAAGILDVPISGEEVIVVADKMKPIFKRVVSDTLKGL
ncbi:MAG: purine-nucleoside phosphorylase [Lachnospirales bacterium]